MSHTVAASLNALLAAGKDHCSAFCELLYSVMKEIVFALPLQTNSGLGHLHETFCFTSVTRSRTLGRTLWMGDQLVTRPLPVQKHRKTHTQHKY
jgi:hypothetical protein